MSDHSLHLVTGARRDGAGGRDFGVHAGVHESRKTDDVHTFSIILKYLGQKRPAAAPSLAHFAKATFELIRGDVPEGFDPKRLADLLEPCRTDAAERRRAGVWRALGSLR